MSALLLILAALAAGLGVWFIPSGSVDGGRSRTITRRSARARGVLDHVSLVGELRRRREREGIQITRLAEVPEMLDILTLGLSAGLSFDASLALYCERFDTPLSELMDLTRLTWSMGVASRSEALSSMAKTVHATSLERFAAAVSESLAFGIPLVQTLVRQASAIRADHRRDVEEAIEKVPVKMLVPLGTLVVPAMLLAVLGPLVAAALTGVG